MATTTVCDACRDTSKMTAKYKIDGGGWVSLIDLCVEDAQVLRDYQALGERRATRADPSEGLETKHLPRAVSVSGGGRSANSARLERLAR